MIKTGYSRGTSLTEAKDRINFFIPIAFLQRAISPMNMKWKSYKEETALQTHLLVITNRTKTHLDTRRCSKRDPLPPEHYNTRIQKPPDWKNSEPLTHNSTITAKFRPFNLHKQTNEDQAYNTLTPTTQPPIPCSIGQCVPLCSYMVETTRNPRIRFSDEKLTKSWTT